MIYDKDTFKHRARRLARELHSRGLRPDDLPQPKTTADDPHGYKRRARRIVRETHSRAMAPAPLDEFPLHKAKAKGLTILD
jgi:hypothetical protein